MLDILDYTLIDFKMLYLTKFFTCHLKILPDRGCLDNFLESVITNTAA